VSAGCMIRAAFNAVSPWRNQTMLMRQC
jgi:hypothetical protein